MKIDTEKIREFYEDYIKRHNTTIGWSSEEAASRCYRAASDFQNQQWKRYQSVLDVGSGEGHLLPFLRSEREFQGHFTGLELLSSFHNRALQLYGNEANTLFIQAEFLSHTFNPTAKFDWVISLGGLSVKQDSQYNYDYKFCDKLLRLARFGVSLYVNDIQNMRPGRQEEYPNLSFHCIPDLVALIRSLRGGTQIEVIHYPSASSQSTIVHVVL